MCYCLTCGLHEAGIVLLASSWLSLLAGSARAHVSVATQGLLGQQHSIIQHGITPHVTACRVTAQHNRAMRRVAAKLPGRAGPSVRSCVAIMTAGSAPICTGTASRLLLPHCVRPLTPGLALQRAKQCAGQHHKVLSLLHATTSNTVDALFCVMQGSMATVLPWTRPHIAPHHTLCPHYTPSYHVSVWSTASLSRWGR